MCIRDRRYVVHPLLHSLQIFAYLLVVNVAFGILIYYVGEENIAAFLDSTVWLQPLIASVVGLIPNCASSVLITGAFIDGYLTFGADVYKRQQHDLRPYGEGGRDAERQPDGADRGKYFEYDLRQVIPVPHFKKGYKKYAQNGEQDIRGGELRGIFYVFVVQPPFERLRRAFAADGGEQ